MDAASLTRDGFRVGDWLVEPGASRASDPAGHSVELTPNQSRLLVALALHHGEPVSRRALRDSLWPGAAGTEEKLRETVAGLRTLSEETLRYYLGLEVGQPFDPLQLDDNIHALWERDLIDDVTVEAAPAAGGVHVTLRIVERPTLRSIEYEGLKKVGRTDLQERIDREQIRVREGTPIDLGELERLENTLRVLYEEAGYRFAQISYTLEEVSPGERRVRFTIDEGDKVKIGDIDFEGNTVYGDWRLKLQMRKTKETGLISRLMKRDIYNPATLQEDVGKLRDLYRERGYKNATIGEPQLEVRARNPEATNPKQQKRRLFLTIPIEEG